MFKLVIKNKKKCRDVGAVYDTVRKFDKNFSPTYITRVYDPIFGKKNTVHITLESNHGYRLCELIEALRKACYYPIEIVSVKRDTPKTKSKRQYGTLKR